MLAGSPGSLAALHAQAGQLITSGGTLADRLRSLRGYPVVLNAWAAWCPPCRAEFSLLARGVGAVRTQGRVPRRGHERLGGRRALVPRPPPVSYPSYSVASTDLSSLAVLEGLPTTIFVNAAGKVVFVHTGEYDTAAALDNDIEHYALGRKAE